MESLGSPHAGSPTGRASENTDAKLDQHHDASLRVFDFSDKCPVMVTTTVLRRLWLLDPDAIPMGPDEATNPGASQSVFDSYFQIIGRALNDDTPDDNWNDEVWRAKTDLALLDPPMGTDAKVPQDKLFVTSFWRQYVHPMYDHVFWDMYQMAKVQDDQIGEYKPPNVEIFGTKPTHPGDERGRDQLRFNTDTFVYPIYIPPRSKLSVQISDEKHIWTSDSTSLTKVVWLEERRLVKFLLEPLVESERITTEAILAIGHCENRTSDLDVQRQNYPPEEGDQESPFFLEAEHLARALFLKAGDALDQCTYDEPYEQPGQEEYALPKVASMLYQPLATERSTRLLVVEPGIGDADLDTRLITVDLDSSPVYEALSYTWGSPSDTTALNCAFGTVMIPGNLEKALRHVRYPDRRRFIWADAVCINQDDIVERGQQVSIMRHIFKAAHCVLAWLGEDENEQAEMAFQTVCHIARSWRLSIGEDKFRFFNYNQALEPIDLAEAEKLRNQLDETGWRALQRMFEAQLFRRVWVIQELALAQRAFMIWGSHHISWGLVGVCAAWLITKGWMFSLESGKSSTALPGPSKAHAAAYNALLIYTLPLASRSAISNFAKLDFSAILGASVDLFKSTDPRDRIYALLGMSFAGNDPNEAVIVQPDYEREVQDVYIDASRRILQQDQHLRLLSTVQHASPESVGSGDYPSWVPRWDKPQLTEPIALREERGYYANAGELLIPDEDMFGEDGRTLFLKGLRCGTVTTVSEEEVKLSHFFCTDPLSDEILSDLRTIYGQLEDESRQFRSSFSSKVEQSVLVGYHSPVEQEEAQKNMMVSIVSSYPGKYGMRKSSEMFTGERAQMDHMSEVILYWRERSSWRMPESALQEMIEKMQQDTSTAKIPIGTTQHPLQTELMLSSINLIMGRKLFRCNDGRIGLGPAAMKDGDVVVVLFGGIVPYVLRPGEDGYWQFVGESFVPGLMQGEAVERAGLLVTGSYERLDDGELRLNVVSSRDEDPRFGRKVGEFGVTRFEIR